jgi:acetolactate synthase-1/2/3 large subunit
MDSIPLVVLTGQVPTELIGNDAFQEVDIVGITRPCTKHNYLVKNTKDIARVVREAFHIARSGRPGPVLVDIPKNVATGIVEFDPEENGKKLTMPAYNPTYEPNTRQLNKVMDMIHESKKPVLFGGGGIILSGATEAFTQLSHRAQIPVTATLMGLGGFPGTDPLWLGMPGMHGTYRANMSLGECDLLIGAGVRFDDRVTGRTDTFAPNAKIVHIDIDPTSIRKNVEVAVPVVGDCKLSLELLNEMIDNADMGDLDTSRQPWLEKIANWKSTQPLAYEQEEDLIKPQYVVEKLFEITEGKAIITTEVGQNQMWAAQYYHFDRPNHFISSGGLGTMGFGLPAALGAQIAFPDKLVVDVAGDGSIQMNIQEMATAVQYCLPVKVAILNNGYLGMVRQWQQFFYDRRYSCTTMDHTPDFAKLAEAYGAVGLRATKPSEVIPVLQEAISTPRPVIMDFVVEQEENVYPMVPAGKSLTEMLLA